MSSMFCKKIYQCRNADWCARDFNPKSDEPECFEQMTNYDLLISKTPEELAELIGDNIDCNICKEKHSADGCPRTAEKDCYGVWLDWLKSPVEVDE